MFVNLTPHDMNLYPDTTPERIEPGSVSPALVIPPLTGQPPARLGHTVTGAGFVHEGVAVRDVVFGHEAGHTTSLPDPVPGTWYLVSLVVGLAATHRGDLLVPLNYVRDLAGNIIGCRELARPAHRIATPDTPTSGPPALARTAVR
jgi:hypothetical protein